MKAETGVSVYTPRSAKNASIHSRGIEAWAALSLLASARTSPVALTIQNCRTLTSVCSSPPRAQHSVIPALGIECTKSVITGRGEKTRMNPMLNLNQVYRRELGASGTWRQMQTCKRSVCPRVCVHDGDSQYVTIHNTR